MKPTTDPTMTVADARKALEKPKFADEESIAARDRLLAHEVLVAFYECQYEHDPECVCRYDNSAASLPWGWRNDAQQEYLKEHPEAEAL